jgi:predicted Ser/Thr protein kinase
MWERMISWNGAFERSEGQEIRAYSREKKRGKMRQSSMGIFCSECGLANDPTATHCSACQHPLVPNAIKIKRMARSIRRILALPYERGLHLFKRHCPLVPTTTAPPTQPPIIPVKVMSPATREVLARSGPSSGQQRVSLDMHLGTILAKRYQIEEEIGCGGFSIVYRGVDLEQNRQVAIKRIPMSGLTPRQIIDATETFNKEFTMLSRFGGLPGIPRFYQKLADAENWYLLMEYIKGQTLEEYLQKSPGGYLSETEVLKIGLELARILRTLHASRPSAIFRDVKPANIMLTPKGKLYVIDFGVARFFTPGKTKDTTPLGSPGYAPPEQYGRAQTDQRADIYGLGATLQTLLTGHDPLELASGELSLNPDPPSPKLRALLDQMLDSEVERRLSDMRQIEERIEKYLPLSAVGYERSLVAGAIAIVTLFVFAIVSIVLIQMRQGAVFIGVAFVLSFIELVALGVVSSTAQLATRRQEASRACFLGCLPLVLYLCWILVIAYAVWQFSY